jgi:hypothetical protein
MPDPEIEREAPVDMTAARLCQPDRGLTASRNRSRAVRVGAESQRQPAGCGSPAGRPGDLNRRLQSQRHDIRAAVATGERRGDMPAIRQHGLS